MSAAGWGGGGGGVDKHGSQIDAFESTFLVIFNLTNRNIHNGKIKAGVAMWRHRCGSIWAQVMACCLKVEPMMTYHQMCPMSFS